MSKIKIINDPVHGFISISSPLIQQLIEHPYVQRLRYIKQLGLTYMVYPGACHNRFQHALGAMHLMDLAIDTLQTKGHKIDVAEKEAALIAILLHDIGHGPFSHALEFSIVDDLHHEQLSLLMMNQLNLEFFGALDLAITIFTGQYHKRFLNDLVSSQLDVDRLDYLQRDSFFSGVIEGMVGVERLIRMMEVDNNALVMEAKAIYSIEKFLLSRRLMYWQVYLHKTVLAAEHIVVRIIRRAKELVRTGTHLFACPSITFFLNPTQSSSEQETLFHFTQLSDCDIESAIKVWAQHHDRVLATLCNMLLKRKLLRVELQKTPFEQAKISNISHQVIQTLGIDAKDIDYFLVNDVVSNKAYSAQQHGIKIKYNDGRLLDIQEVSDLFGSDHPQSINTSYETSKYMLCYPKLDQ